MPDNVKAKLATIETNQVHQSKKMDEMSAVLKQVGKLLERFVRLEENHKSTSERLNHLESRVEDVEKAMDTHDGELNKWAVYRKQLTWTSRILGAVIGGLILYYFTGD